MSWTQTQYPRRIDTLRWTDAERAISAAVAAVEAVGADPLLTDAVILLAEAREKVADFVDGPGDPRTTFRRENPMVLRQESTADADTDRLNRMEDEHRGVEAITADDESGNPTRKLWARDGAGIEFWRPTIREAIDDAPPLPADEDEEAEDETRS